ncbi:MAG: hypothetical protein FJZ01_05480 [Candidatus Sericytochromatia bacterium]|nr:hypothetical protein [Candidatus Tanganyikabacteria bacterium]
MAALPGGRLLASCGPALAALTLSVLAGGSWPQLAVLGVVAAVAGGMTWLAASSRQFRDLAVVTGPAIAGLSGAASVVLTWNLAPHPAAIAASWFGPALVLCACVAWEVKPGQDWPPGTPARLAALPLRVALGLAGGCLAAVAAALAGVHATTWPVALGVAFWAAVAGACAILPLKEDILQGRAAYGRLDRLRELLWADPDLEARAAGLQRDLQTAQDRLAEQNRVIGDLKAVISEQMARIDRLAHGYRRVREAAEANLGLLGRVRGEVESSLNDVGIISDSVGQIVGTSEATDALIDESRQRLREALESMEYVRLSIEDSLDLVEAFAKRSRQIEDVLKDIADIAYFTRILSLNAKIEAARAGEQGKGFRFLADEVQKLAQTITQSTSDITALLKLVQQESKQTVESVLRSANQVGEAADTVSLLDDALGRIMAELHSMDADLQDAHLLSLRVSQTREEAMTALDAIEDGNRRADFAARMVEEIAAEEPKADFAAHAHAEPPDPSEGRHAPTGQLAGTVQTAPLDDMEWPEELE